MWFGFPPAAARASGKPSVYRRESSPRFGINLDTPDGLQRLDTFERSRRSTLNIFHFVGIKDGQDKLPGIATVLGEAVGRAKKEEQDHIVLQGGDLFLTRDPETIKRGIKALNKMGLHAQVWGNFDFDLGIDQLLISASYANFPVVVHNVRFEDPDHPLKKAANFVHDKPLVLKGQNSGEPYGLIGLTTPLIHEEVTDGTDLEGIEGLSFDETVTRTLAMIEDLNDRGIRRILVLSHMGGDLDRRLQKILQARQATNNLVIVGARDEKDPVDFSPEASFIRAPGPSAEGALSVLQVPYQEDGSFQISRNTIDTGKVEPDQAIEQIIRPEASPVALRFQFYTEDGRPLEHYLTENTLTGNDGLAQWVSVQLQQATGADIAFCKSALIRANLISGGEITEEKLKTGMFIDNRLTTVRHVKGASIRQALEEAASTLMEEPVNASRQGILPSAQLKYTLNLDPEHDGPRVSNLEIRGKDGQWRALNDDEEYTVAGDSFLFKARSRKYFPALQIPNLGVNPKQDVEVSSESIGALLARRVRSEHPVSAPLIQLRPEPLITFSRPSSAGEPA